MLTSGQKAIIRAAVEENLADLLADPNNIFEQGYLMGYVHGAVRVLRQTGDDDLAYDLYAIRQRAERVK